MIGSPGDDFFTGGVAGAVFEASRGSDVLVGATPPTGDLFLEFFSRNQVSYENYPNGVIVDLKIPARP